jgi:UDP-glucose 4-epimerase
MEGVDYVFHEAATNINRSIKYPGESFDVNFNGSYVVFKSAKEHNVKKVLFASSASVYGQPDVLPMREDGKLSPITPYCICKLSSEYLLRCFDLKFIIFRYFNVYGFGQHVDAYYTSVINTFRENLLRGDPPIIAGDGNQSMDFIHVSDVVNANILGLESNVENEVFNLGSGVSTTVRELAYKLIKLAGKKVDPIFSSRKVIVDKRMADIQKIRKFLGFIPKVTLEDGLHEVIGGTS